MDTQITKYKDLYLSTNHERYSGNFLTDIVTALDAQIISAEQSITDLEQKLDRSPDLTTESKKKLTSELRNATKLKKKRESLKKEIGDLSLIYSDNKDGVTWFIAQSQQSWEHIYGISSVEKGYVWLSEPLDLHDEGMDNLAEIKILSVNDWVITYGMQSDSQLSIDEHDTNASTNNNKEVIKFRKYFIEKEENDNSMDLYLNGSFAWLKQSIGNSKVIVEYVVNELQDNLAGLTKLMTVKDGELHLETRINGTMLNDFVKNTTMKELFDTFGQTNQ